MTDADFAAALAELQTQIADVDSARAQEAAAFAVMTTAIADYNTAEADYNAAITAYNTALATANSASTAYITGTNPLAADLISALQALQSSIIVVENKKTTRDTKWNDFQIKETSYNNLVTSVATLVAIVATSVAALLNNLTLTPAPTPSAGIGTTPETGGARLGETFATPDPR